MYQIRLKNLRQIIPKFCAVNLDYVGPRINIIRISTKKCLEQNPLLVDIQCQNPRLDTEHFCTEHMFCPKCGLKHKLGMISIADENQTLTLYQTGICDNYC